MKMEERTELSVRQIKLAFLGATCNLYLLENVLMKIKNIPFYQYVNYLSQLALCIELGFKSMIINTDDFKHIHCLDKLFNETPKAFQEKIQLLHPDASSYILNMKDIFIDFRYMKEDSILKEYLDESVINSNGSIDIQKVVNLLNFQFLRNLLEEIIEYEKFLQNETINQITEYGDTDVAIKQYIDILKSNQQKIVLREKGI